MLTLISEKYKLRLVKMNTQELKEFHQCKTRRELSKKTGYSEVTLWKWEKFGIPPRTQAHLELLSKGGLKANLQVLSA